MKKPQWITIGIGIFLTFSIFLFARRVPENRAVSEVHSADDGHNHGNVGTGEVSIDSVLSQIKKQLSPQQVATLSKLETTLAESNPATGGQAKSDDRLHTYHQLGRYWGDSIGFTPARLWYTAEAARLENSEKSLTFAAHLILNNIQQGHDSDPAMIRWKGLQAKDLFERSLIINPANDSSKVGIGACYIFGSISPAPMDGIRKILEVVEKDSTNIYAQMTLVRGSLISGQIDKAIERLSTVCRMHPGYAEGHVLLGDIYAQSGKKQEAIGYYLKGLKNIKIPEVKQMIEDRITELSK